MSHRITDTQPKITIAEVAQEAGVSIATVSRVLNQRDGKIKISDETKQQVQAAADRLGYRVDPFALALRTRRTGLVGAIIRDLRDPFLIEVFIEMQSAAREKGLDLLLGNANFDISVAGHQASIMNSLWFDGLILLGDMPGDLSVVNQLKHTHKPCVAVASGTRHDLPSVNLDEIASVHMALSYLTGLGHRRIACMADPDLLGVRERLAAFQDSAAAFGLILDERYVQTCPSNRSEAAARVLNLLNLPIPPTAIICGTDIIALGVMHQLARTSYRVPQDISLIGFDDIKEAANSLPPLSTIRQPAGLIAGEALDLLLKIIDCEPGGEESASVLIQPQLITRESCAAPREIKLKG
ncbi:MAG: LacI family transcriptional regulator [Anaerolineae bacterium]|nr:LacI family transcriptional regulator [Anaerolineae bacterium]